MENDLGYLLSRPRRPITFHSDFAIISINPSLFQTYRPVNIRYKGWKHIRPLHRLNWTLFGDNACTIIKKLLWLYNITILCSVDVGRGNLKDVPLHIVTNRQLRTMLQNAVPMTSAVKMQEASMIQTVLCYLFIAYLWRNTCTFVFFSLPAASLTAACECLCVILTDDDAVLTTKFNLLFFFSDFL